MEFDNNRINFNNIKLFLDAVDLTNYDILLNFNNQNDFICHFLSTGDYHYLSKSAKKVLKGTNIEELKLDIQSALLCYDVMNNDFRNFLMKIYGYDYWKTLYNNLGNIKDHKAFIEQYKDNFNTILKKSTFAYNNIIYWILSDTLELKNVITRNDIKLNQDDLVNMEYLLKERDSIKRVKTKKLFGKSLKK